MPATAAEFQFLRYFITSYIPKILNCLIYPFITYQWPQKEYSLQLRLAAYMYTQKQLDLTLFCGLSHKGQQERLPRHTQLLPTSNWFLLVVREVAGEFLTWNLLILWPYKYEIGSIIFHRVV